MADARCGTCGETPCKNPRLCLISETAQALMQKTTGECNGCRQGLPDDSAEHTCH